MKTTQITESSLVHDPESLENEMPITIRRRTRKQIEALPPLPTGDVLAGSMMDPIVHREGSLNFVDIRSLHEIPANERPKPHASRVGYTPTTSVY